MLSITLYPIRKDHKKETPAIKAQTNHKKTAGAVNHLL